MAYSLRHQEKEDRLGHFRRIVTPSLGEMEQCRVYAGGGMEGCGGVGEGGGWGGEG